MTNKEFYFDKLLAVALENACRKLRKAVYGESCIGKKKCEDCEFSGVENIENWLNAEHKEPEPPLLENGDGLKPGDWIMVRDNGTWSKRRFIGYFEGRFYAKHPLYINAAASWEQARLPKEDE